MMPYLLPPAGFPISVAELARIIKSRYSAEKYWRLFREGIIQLTGARYCFLYNLGRTALYYTLEALFRLSGSSRTEVVIPAYTCFSVAAPVARLGIKIRLVDIVPATMDFDYEKLAALDYSNVLAIVPCNLFGILSNWDRLWSIGRKSEVYLIDDAAQAMGSTFMDRPAGCLGDAGIFSLDRGKPLSTYQGGIMVTNDEEIAESVRKSTEHLASTGLKEELLTAIKIVFYSVMSNPKLYWLPDAMPFLKLGETVFDEDFQMTGLSSFQSCAGAILFPKLEETMLVRRMNSAKMAREILRLDRYSIPGYREDFCPAYLRLPLLAPDMTTRDRAIKALRKRGVVASRMYPSTIREIPGIEHHLASTEDDFPGAMEVVERILTLPTHAFLTDRDVRNMVSCLAEE